MSDSVNRLSVYSVVLIDSNKTDSTETTNKKKNHTKLTDYFFRRNHHLEYTQFGCIVRVHHTRLTRIMINK